MAFEVEMMTIQIPVSLHDEVRAAAVREAEAKGLNPGRYKTAWVLDAMRAKLAADSSIQHSQSPGEGKAGRRG